jgi:hypothetical protein
MALTEALARMLAPGGLLVLATPVDLTADSSYAVLRGDPSRAAWWVPSRQALIDICRLGGFERVEWFGAFPVPTTTEPDRAGIMGVVHARQPAGAG